MSEYKTPKPNVHLGLYRHYKGGVYTVVGVAHDSTNGPGEGRWLVIYISADVGILNARDINQFFGAVDGGIPRFEFMERDPEA